MDRIPIIVVTGGPCAGKTTALAHMHKWLSEHGYQPVIVPEAATQLISAGFDPREPYFQEQVLKRTLADETLYRDAIVAYGYPKGILLCDRGIPDQCGYMDASTFESLCEKFDVSPVEVRDKRYNGTIFLRSAAHGAESFYSHESNAARYETLDEARALDQRTLDAWVGTPHLSIIQNESDKVFEDKIRASVQALAHILGVPEPLEQERKFRLTQFNHTLLPQNAVGIDIVQTYLISRDGIAERIRARGQNNQWVYFHTTKEPRGPGVSVERDSIISRDVYENFMIRRNTHLKTIHKKRWCFEHAGRYCEVDVFQGHQAGLVMLEIEYDSDPHTIVVPSFLGEYSDVTEDTKYSNYVLAA